MRRPPSQLENNQSNEKTDGTPAWWRLVECIGIAAAVIYAGIAYYQWRDAQHNFRVDERAWLGIKDVQAEMPLSAGKPLTVNINVTNTGKTPGLNLVLSDLTMGAPEKGLKNVGSREGAVAVAPNGNNVFYVTTPGVLSASDVDDLQGTTAKIYVRGVFVYVDIFGETHRTGFCQVYPTTHKPNFFNCPDGGNWMN